MRFNSAKNAKTLFHVETVDGEENLTYKPDRNYLLLASSTLLLAKGKNREIYAGGTDDVFETDGCYAGGSFSDGSLFPVSAFLQFLPTINASRLNSNDFN